MHDWQGALSVWDWAAVAFYLVVVVAAGLVAGRFTQTSHDFFFGGQRFSWWFVAVSCVATLVGSYSFQQYSELGFKYGCCSMMPYTNEWFVLPWFLLGWLPIVYYSRVHSIPEYFERRFDLRTRLAVLAIMLVYLEVYIGINLITIGLLFHGVYPLEFMFSGADAWWPGVAEWVSPREASVLTWGAVLAVLSLAYMLIGGQNSVMLADLFQAFLLLSVGLGVLFVGVSGLGGVGTWWEAALPATHRLPHAQFNRPPGLNAVGDFWNDAIVGTFAFYMINQGILMRFLSAKSVREGRRAMLVVVAVLMPVAAVAVSGAGWVGRALWARGELPAVTQGVDSAPSDASAVSTAAMAVERASVEKQTATDIFVTVARRVCRLPGTLGLVLAAVLAALMSTLDAYITAVAAVAVNDIWRKLHPQQSDRFFLTAARVTAVLATLVGIALVPLFTRFDSIYQALSFFTSAINPPLVVVILLAIAWRGFGARAAFWTLIFGGAAMCGSLAKPELILPISHGDRPTDGFPYLRALFGLLVSLPLAVTIGCFDRSRASRQVAARWAFWFVLLGLMLTVYWGVPPLVGAEVGAPRTIAAELLVPQGRSVAWLAAALLAAAAASGWIAVRDVQPRREADPGLSLATLETARERFKGAPLRDEGIGRSIVLALRRDARVAAAPLDGGWSEVRLSAAALRALSSEPGDLLYVSDARRWLGGFRSLHVRAGEPLEEGAEVVCVSPDVIARGHLLADRPVRVERIL